MSEEKGEYLVNVPAEPQQALVPIAQGTEYLVRAETTPTEVVARASEQARAVIDVVEKKKLYGNIKGKKFLTVEAWQLVAAFNGLSPVVEKVERTEHDGAQGWQARCVIYNAQGRQVGAGEAECLDDEDNWRGKPDYQLKSMAQTRAVSKACRTILSFVVALAGYEVTPYEEMEGVKATYGSTKRKQQPAQPSADQPASEKQKSEIEFLLAEKNISITECEEKLSEKFSKQIKIDFTTMLAKQAAWLIKELQAL